MLACTKSGMVGKREGGADLPGGVGPRRLEEGAVVPVAGQVGRGVVRRPPGDHVRRRRDARGCVRRRGGRRSVAVAVAVRERVAVACGRGSARRARASGRRGRRPRARRRGVASRSACGLHLPPREAIAWMSACASATLKTSISLSVNSTKCGSVRRAVQARSADPQRIGVVEAGDGDEVAADEVTAVEIELAEVRTAIDASP